MRNAWTARGRRRCSLWQKLVNSPTSLSGIGTRVDPYGLLSSPQADPDNQNDLVAHRVSIVHGQEAHSRGSIFKNYINYLGTCKVVCPGG